MQNQDPLNPMDNAQVTSQMAQIQTVTGIDKLNTTVAGLNSQFVQMQALQGRLAGRARRDRAGQPDGHRQRRRPGRLRADFGGRLGQGRESSRASGQVVDTLDLARATAGCHSFDWTPPARRTTPGCAFRVTSRLGSVNTTATALVRDSVSAVSTTGTGFSLELSRLGSVGAFRRQPVAFN